MDKNIEAFIMEKKNLAWDKNIDAFIMEKRNLGWDNYTFFSKCALA